MILQRGTKEAMRLKSESSYKTELNLLLMKNKKTSLVYQTVRTGGPDHLPTFRSSAVYDEREYLSKEHNSKSEAEEDLARIILGVFNN